MINDVHEIPLLKLYAYYYQLPIY